MTTVLRIDASTRLQNSLSRELADTFERCLAEAVPDLKILRRDVGQTPPFIICEAWVAAAFSHESARTADQRKLLALSDTLIEEVSAADCILLSTPMYNYGMPAGLKAWVDQVVRIGKTFTFDLARGDRPLEPILSGKTLILTTACGEFGFETGEPNAAHNHLAPHVRTIGKYLGVEQMHHIAIEYQEFKDQRHAASVSSAHRQARELVERLTGARMSA